MDNDEKYMLLALKEAKKAYNKNEVPIGAVLVENDRVIARAHNMREIKQLTMGHAEMLCLEKANKKKKLWRLDEATMYVTIEPCPMCAGAILQARIKRLVFGAVDIKAGCAGSLYNLLNDSRFNHKVDISSGILENECSQIMKKFFSELRKKKRN